MKKILAMVLAMLLILSMTACGDKGGKEDGGEGSKTVSFNQLMNAFVNDGYTVQKDPDPDATAADFDIHSSIAFEAMGFYKEVGVVEKYGVAFLAQFENASATVTAFDELCQLLRSDGIPVQVVSSSNGKKVVYSEVEPDYGEKYIISQVENTIIYAAEYWEIDGDASYDDSLAKIINGLGY